MKQKILAATNNQNKAKEFKEILGDDFEIITLKDLDIKVDPQETGSTFLDNAIIKAKAVFEAAGELYPVIADDSGLVVPALGGEPGVMSARYAGTDADDFKNNQKLLKNLENVSDRGAYFICVIAYLDKDKIITAEGKTFGEILKEPVGNNGFGYDPLFYSYDLKMSFGEASADLKNQVSHRARALGELAQKLEALK
ncbi:MAG TPA: RdgB/HAM1 family non-canonical purine NTP pyrophosphatase [Clostridia bacterium]